MNAENIDTKLTIRESLVLFAVLLLLFCGGFVCLGVLIGMALKMIDLGMKLTT